MPDSTYERLDDRVTEIEKQLRDFRPFSEIEKRLRATETKLSETKTSLARGDLQFEFIKDKLNVLDEINEKVSRIDAHSDRLDNLEASKTWIIRLIIGGVIGAIMTALVAGKFAS